MTHPLATRLANNTCFSEAPTCFFLRGAHACFFERERSSCLRFGSKPSSNSFMLNMLDPDHVTKNAVDLFSCMSDSLLKSYVHLIQYCLTNMWKVETLVFSFLHPHTSFFFIFFSLFLQPLAVLPYIIAHLCIVEVLHDTFILHHYFIS